MTDLQIGDKVTVEWVGRYHETPGVSEDRGTVKYISPRFVEIAHPAGYAFTVGSYHLASGTKITIKERAAMADKITFSVPEGADWKEHLTREKYLELKKDGLTDRKIAKACRISPVSISNWKTEKNLIGVKLDAGGELVFPDDDKGDDGSDDERVDEQVTELELRERTKEIQARVLGEDDVGGGADQEMTVAEAIARLEALVGKVDRHKAEIERIKNARVVM